MVPVLSKSATAPDSYGSVRSTSAARSSSVCWAADCKSAAAESCGCCYMPVRWVVSAAARDRCCNRAPGRWSRKTARLHVPRADDWPGYRELTPLENFLPDRSFRILPADGPDHLHFPALPRCARHCRRAASRCCPLHPWNCGSSYSSPRAAGSATVPVAGNLSRRMGRHCPHGRSLPARCAPARCRCARESSPRY